MPLLSTVIVRKDIMSVMPGTADVLYHECMQILNIVHTSRSVALFFPLIFLFYWKDGFNVTMFI